MNKYMCGPEDSLGDVRLEKSWMSRSDKKLYERETVDKYRVREGLAVRVWPFSPRYGHTRTVLSGDLQAPDLKGI